MKFDLKNIDSFCEDLRNKYKNTYLHKDMYNIVIYTQNGLKYIKPNEYFEMREHIDEKDNFLYTEVICD
jgi:glycerol-3-phosphate responsive antiterminator